MRLLGLALIIFVFYRVGNFIPLPFVLTDGTVSDLFSQVTKTGIVNQQALQRMSLFSLGIVPYITAGIVIQLIKYIFADTSYGASLKDRKTLSSQTLLFTFIISIFQSIMFSNYALAENYTIQNALFVTLCLVAGSFITVWFSKIITTFGYGNGASILIMFSIIEYLFISSSDIFSGLSTGVVSPLDFGGHLIYFIASILIVTFVESAYRPLKLIYPSQKQQFGYNKGKKTDILPLKINNSGVLPLIFAMSFSAVLSLFVAPYIFDQFNIDISLLLTFVTLAFVIFFVIFYTPLVLNTEEISKNLKKSSILCENRRPGDVTKKYIDSVVEKLNYIAIIYLGTMVVVPDMLRTVGTNVIISGVSCVILVVVIMDIIRRAQYLRYSQKFQTLVN